HKKYLERQKNESEKAEELVLNFLGWEVSREEVFGQDIRIILVSSDFSKEITTSVLWLNERDLDIKCVRIKPQKDNEDLYFDIQQIVPLPETQDYQIKIKEKVAEERQSIRDSSERDYSKYTISLNGINKENLNKRKAIYYVISSAIKFKINPEELFDITTQGKWIWVNKACNTRIEFETEMSKSNRKYDPTRWFVEDKELLVFGEKTFAFSNQHSKEAYNIISKIFEKYPQLNGTIEISE
ncbi:MAG: hypothetical protein Q7J86_09100, partial [Bacteroidota bacterium]|nr:hypothetical protein [Bacteroidota bacterium]